MLKVSIIVTAQNCSKDLNKCLESILTQSYKNIELILVDASSTDNSLAICESFAKLDRRVKLVSLHSTSLSTARNTALALATGHYLMFANCNDYLEKNAVEEAVSIAQRSNSEIVLFEWYEQSPQGTHLAPVPCKIRNTTAAILGDILSDRQPAYTWNKLYSASLWQATKFDSTTDEANTVKEVFAKSKKSFYLPVPLCVHKVKQLSIAPKPSSVFSRAKKLLLSALLQLKP